MQFEGLQVVVVVGDWLVDFVAAPPIFLCHTGPEGRQSVQVQSLRGAVAVEGREGEEGMNVLIENLLGPVLQGYQRISRPGCIMVWIGFNSFSSSKG